MTEEEKMVFWGDLVEPMTALLGGLLVRGEFKLIDVLLRIVAKAENAAAKREWVGLTDEEVGMLTVFDGLHHVETPLLADFIRAIEAKLNEKNT